MSCQHCGSSRVASVTAKCADLCCVDLGEHYHDGYVPRDMGICDEYGDYVEFDYCLDCGQIQGEFPLPETKLERGEEI